jgi:uncharacterized protein (DUF2141 family)
VIFDEYIQEKNLRTVISSAPELPGLKFVVSGKKLELVWEDQPMRENTTYRIDLGSAVGDLNENNPVNNLQFVWSTGAAIDSLQWHGQLAPGKGKTYEGVVVWLINPGDTTWEAPAFSKTVGQKPSIDFSYLPNKEYDLLAFQDLNFDGKPDTTREQYGFLKSCRPQVDSNLVAVSMLLEGYEAPSMDSAFADSMNAVLDTMVAEELGTLTIVVPPMDSVGRRFALTHSSGWFIERDFAANTDTLLWEVGDVFAGKYVVRGFIDANGDGMWNKASWGSNRQAEVILPETSFELKANWELEQTLNMPE